MTPPRSARRLGRPGRPAPRWSRRCARAAAGHGMTHAWLFTGPPGLGPVQRGARVRGGAAVRAGPPGCGELPRVPHRAGRLPRRRPVIRTEKLSIGVDEVRELVRRAALAPVGRRWQVMIVEDADRLTDQAANALLKAIEEPTERTVWLLCAPTVEDVLPTIRSRMPAGRAGHAHRRRRRRLPGARRRGRRRARVVRRPRQPGPHRPGPRAGPRRGHPQPPPRGGRDPGPADLAWAPA